MFKKLFKQTKKEPERPARPKGENVSVGRQQKKDLDKKESQAKALEKPREIPKAPEVKGAVSANVGKYADILLAPRVTEKATGLSGGSAYVFVVRQDSTKPQIKQAVQALYDVEPKKVRITNFPAKQVRSNRGIRGVKQGGKKAVVYLREGDSIQVT